MSEEDGFLSRWSARKRGKAEEPEEAEAPVADVEGAPEPELSEEDYLAEHDLTDPDEMAQDDDFAAFMKTGVPAALKRRALRRLWTLNPVLANVDGLVEYGEDYTDAATVVANLQTGYQVGKGFVKEVLEPDEADAEAEIAEAEADAEGAGDEDKEEAAEAEATDTAENHVEPDTGAPEDLPEPEIAALEPGALEPDPAPPPRRRMAFHFD